MGDSGDDDGLCSATAAAIAAVVVCYVFYGFYIVTDVFLVPSVSSLCNRLHIPDDVAGAGTLAGAGLRVPRLMLAGLMITYDPHRSTQR